MREIRLSGSEGGGARRSPYPVLYIIPVLTPSRFVELVGARRCRSDRCIAWPLEAQDSLKLRHVYDRC